MSMIGISICDMCAKRTEQFVGRLSLQTIKNGRRGGAPTARSWQLCKSCYNKIHSINTVGDTIREDIEIHLDKLRGDNSNIKLLMKGV